MGIPDYQSCMFPLLRLVAEKGRCQLREILDELADQFGLSASERTKMLPSGSQGLFENRVAWAKTYLKQAGLLAYPLRGVMEITEEGGRVLASGIDGVDSEYLKRYPSFLTFLNRTKTSAGEASDLNPDLLEELLQEFSEVADKRFAEDRAAIDYWKFMREFFRPENLEKAEWQDIQRLGDHIHSLQSYAIAKANAFGNPNFPIPQYRESFLKLAHGKGSVEERMRWFMTDETATSKYLGASSVSEIMGQLNADTHVPYNKRDEEAARFLGIDPGFVRGDDAARRFAKFNQAIRPVFEAYEEVVGRRSDAPIGLEVDQFFSWLYETRELGKREKAEVAPSGGPRVWEYAPGQGAAHWDAFFHDGVMALGWNELSDLQQFRSKAEIAEAVKREFDLNHEPINDSLALWQFVHDMKPGDIVLAKKGRRALIGRGVVAGDYEYRPERSDYHHVRSVKWELDGFWQLPTGNNLTVKTLTEITQYPDHVARLMSIIDGEAPPVARDRGYWWLNCNPSIWDVTKTQIGEKVIYTSHNEDGNKRQKYKYFEAAQVGDGILAYVTSPVRQVMSRMVVTRELGETDEGEGIEMEVVEHLEARPSWDDLKADARLADCEPLASNQGSLFLLTEEEFGIISERGSGIVPDSVEPYTREDALEDLYMEEAVFLSILDRLEQRRNVILQGPPGVGKTFIAHRVAFAFMEKKDVKRMRMVQFHQSYSYEDFVRGYRPSENGGFTLKDGVFFQFCEAARVDDRPYVFIIDEINRGNLSKILGELMMLIEHDKRSPLYGVPLACQREGEPDFHVPGNVYIVGLMNTADRSLAMVDYALRRRFSFIDVRPAFASQAFKQRLEAMCSGGLGGRIVEAFEELNSKIAADTDNLGRGFCIGHSYFCLRKNELLDGPGYRGIIETEIAPLLREYWFDQPQIADDLVAGLMAITG